MVDETEEEVNELENKIEQLEDRLDRLESRNSTNTIELSSFDLRVSLSSESCDMETLTQLASKELRKSEKRALVGEYQELEEEQISISDLF